MKKVISFVLTTLIFFPVLAGCNSTSVDKNKSFKMNDKSIQMNCYEEYAIKCDYENISLAEDVKWTSSALNVCKVDNGIITSVGVGRATVTAKYADEIFSASVLVTASKIGRALLVDKSSLVLEVGNQEKITASLKESGVIKNDANIVYESSLPEIISVDKDGNVKALQRGKAVVSCYTEYKGQKFTKDIPVASVALSSQETTFKFDDEKHEGSSITPYNDGQSLGFDENDKVFEYISNGDMESRIFVDGAYTNNVANFERLSFKIKFSEVPEKGTTLYLGYGKKNVVSNSDLVTSSTALLFYDYRGRIADYLRIGKVYTVVINLNKNGQGLIDGDTTIFNYGFAFNKATKAYISSPVLSSSDYLYHSLGFEEPEELPELNFSIADGGPSLERGVEPIPYFDNYWIGYSSGTAQWDDSVWNNRIIIGGLTYANYRNYKYYQADIVFNNVDFNEILIWTGGYSIKVSPSYTLSSTEGTPTPEDLMVYCDDQLLSYGTKFETNKIYTFKIRIQSDNLENVAFGISVFSPTRNPIYFANPLFTNI